MCLLGWDACVVQSGLVGGLLRTGQRTVAFGAKGW